MDGPVGRGFDSPHLHIVVLFLLQLYKTGRHFFYLLYINKLHKLNNFEIQSLLLFFTILRSYFQQLQTLKEATLPRSISIYRETFKGTEKNFIVPSSVLDFGENILPRFRWELSQYQKKLDSVIQAL